MRDRNTETDRKVAELLRMIADEIQDSKSLYNPSFDVTVQNMEPDMPADVEVEVFVTGDEDIARQADAVIMSEWSGD